MRARAVLVGLSAMLLAACGAELAAPDVAPDTLVLRAQEVRSGPAPWEMGQLPDFSLYGGGRVVVAAEPAGALEQAREFQLTIQEFERLVADAGAAGLDESRTYEDTDTTDASLLVVSLRTNDGVRTTRIAAPEESGGLAVEYVERLPEAPQGAHEFRPTALAVLATSGVGEGLAAEPWPLHPLAEGVRTSEGRCTVVTGDELTTAARLAANARQETLWSSGDTLYAVSFRPLLPDEHTCEDIDTR